MDCGAAGNIRQKNRLKNDGGEMEEQGRERNRRGLLTEKKRGSVKDKVREKKCSEKPENQNKKMSPLLSSIRQPVWQTG